MYRFHKPLFTLFFFLLIGTNGCGGMAELSDIGFGRQSHKTPPSPVLNVSMDPSGEPLDIQKIIKVAWLELESKNPERAAESIRKRVESMKGYVVSNKSGKSGEKWVRMVVRIPATKLESTLTWAGNLGTVVSKDIQGEDVTDSYYDLESKIENTRKIRDRLKELLSEAKTVEETLKVEVELARVQEKLDIMTGRFDRMQMQIAYSTLTVRIDSDEGIPGPLTLLFRGLYWAVKKLFWIG